MPVAAHIDPSARIVMFRCSGPLVLSEARKAIDQMISDPSFEPGIHTLWDMRAASVGARHEEIPDILGLIQSRRVESGGRYRVAILVEETSETGVSTLVEKNAHAMPYDVRVFFNYKQAAGWLAGDDV
jgi:hypothetical protein